MPVETYECSEVSVETPECEEEALTLIESLGLDGQKSLIGKKGADDEQSRCPYPIATDEQLWVFLTLCPEKTPIKKYKRTAIPLRVLQVVAHAQSLGFFDEIVVWDQVESKIADPVVMGRVGTEYSVRAWHLLARWGNELEAWQVLLQKAAESYRTKAIAVAGKIADSARVFADSLRNASLDEIIVGKHNIPYSFLS